MLAERAVELTMLPMCVWRQVIKDGRCFDTGGDKVVGARNRKEVEAGYSLFGPGVGCVGRGTVCDIHNGAPPAQPFLVTNFLFYFFLVRSCARCLDLDPIIKQMEGDSVNEPEAHIGGNLSPPSVDNEGQFVFQHLCDISANLLYTNFVL